MTKKLKITGVNCYKDKNYGYVDKNLIKFTAWFSDGIVMIYHYVNEQLQYDGMLSVGTDSYFLSTGKWPTDNNIKKRTTLVNEWVLKNINRYKPIKELKQHPDRFR